MKKKLFSAITPALVLVCGILFFACATVSTPAPGAYTVDDVTFTIGPEDTWAIKGNIIPTGQIIKGEGTYEISPDDNTIITLFTNAPVTDDNGYHVIEVEENEGHTKMEPVAVGTVTFFDEMNVVKVAKVSFNGKVSPLSGKFRLRLTD
jgi:hypothetical protein